MTELAEGLLDTSVFIAGESRRPLDASLLPARAYVSVVTLAELQAGVLAAADTGTRAVRLATLEAVAALDLLHVDALAAAHWATMRVRLAEGGRRANVNDLWVAAVALANGLPVITQDGGFDVLTDLGGPAVVRV
ncbi:PIN domain-containing protein [Cellulomonas hominis]